MRIEIHQAWYHPAQREHLDPAFTPLDNTANPHPDQAETYLFRRHYTAGHHHLADVTGVVSWRFGEKTNLGGDSFFRFIQERPGYDVYLINPFPSLAQSYRNVWHHGEAFHEDMLGYAQEVFNMAGHRIDLASLAMSEAQTLYCNYWAGTPAFWERYMAFALPISDAMLQPGKHVPSSGYVGSYHLSTMSYYPFIMERVFSTLLATQPDIKASAYVYPPEYVALSAKYLELANHLVRTGGVYDSSTVRMAARLARIPGVEPVSRKLLNTMRGVRTLLKRG
ncbi:MAG TPA: hypothetical protein VF678_07900 [bacterium]